MSRKDNDQQRKRDLPWDRIGILALLAILLFTILAYRNHKRQEELRQIRINREIVQAMELRSVGEIESRLKEIKKEFNIGKIATESIPNRRYFEDAVFMGDSLTSSLSGYEVLPKASVVAEVGRNTKTALADVAKLEDLLPGRVFLWYGMNDLSLFKDPAQFKTSYAKLISQVAVKKPGVQIALLSILPATDQAVKKDATIARDRVAAFNQEISKLAKEKGYRYLDVAEILTPESYEPDGIHVKASFYEEMLNYIKGELIND